MRKSLAVAAMAAATLLASGATATASESPSPTDSSSSSPSSSDGSATPLEVVRAYSEPSIVYIETKWTGYVYDDYNKVYVNDGQPISVTGACTGFIVRPDGYIATAGHCVNGPEFGEYYLLQRAAEIDLEQYYQGTDLTVDDLLAANMYVIHNQSGRRAKPQMQASVYWPQSAGGVQTSKGLPARVVKWQKFNQGDGAVLKVEEDGMNALPIAQGSPEVGSDVVTIGYPASIDTTVDADLTPSFKMGSVSSQKTVGGGLTTVYEIDAAISKGMSGGPAVNLDGEVVGVISFHPPSESQSFNFIQPGSVITELLGDTGQPNLLSEDTLAYREGLDALFAGDKETAVEKLGLVYDNQPTNELAKEYLDQAQELPDPVEETTPSSDEEDSSNMGLIIGIVVGLLVLAALAVGLLLMLSRGKKKGSAASATTGPAYGGLPPSPGPTYIQPGPGSGGGAANTAVITPPASQQSLPSSPPSPAPLPPAAPAAGPAPAAPEVEEDIFCANCGTKGESHQKFCKHCGAPLGG